MTIPTAAGPDIDSIRRSDHSFIRRLIRNGKKKKERNISGDSSSSYASISDIFAHNSKNNAHPRRKQARRRSSLFEESTTFHGSSSTQFRPDWSNESLTVQLLWDDSASGDLGSRVTLPRTVDNIDIREAHEDCNNSSRLAQHPAFMHDSCLTKAQSARQWLEDSFGDGAYNGNSDHRKKRDSIQQESGDIVWIEQSPLTSHEFPWSDRRRQVRFGVTRVREYRVIVDTPATSCNQGRARPSVPEQRTIETCPLTLDWSHAPVDFCYPALMLGYQSYFCNRPCPMVNDKRLLLCQLHDWNADELRLRQIQAIAVRVADLILESAQWPLSTLQLDYPDPENSVSAVVFPEASDDKKICRWLTGSASSQDKAPFNKRASSRVFTWKRAAIYSPTGARINVDDIHHINASAPTRHNSHKNSDDDRSPHLQNKGRPTGHKLNSSFTEGDRRWDDCTGSLHGIPLPLEMDNAGLCPKEQEANFEKSMAENEFEQDLQYLQYTYPTGNASGGTHLYDMINQDTFGTLHFESALQLPRVASTCSLDFVRSEKSLQWDDLADRTYNNRVHHVEQVEEEMLLVDNQDAWSNLLNQFQTEKCYRGEE